MDGDASTPAVPEVKAEAQTEVKSEAAAPDVKKEPKHEPEKRKPQDPAEGYTNGVKKAKKDDSDDEDVLLSALKKEAKPKENKKEKEVKKEPKKEEKKKGEKKKEEKKKDTKKRNAESSDSDDDIPIGNLKKKAPPKKKAKKEESDSEDEPLANLRSKKASAKKESKKKKDDDSSDDEPIANLKKKDVKKEPKKEAKKGTAKKDEKKPAAKKSVKKEEANGETPKKGRAKKEEEPVHEWWNMKLDLAEGQRWKNLEHKCPVLAPAYQRLPSNIKFYYDGKPVDLCEKSEEVAGFYAAMIKTDYASKDIFINNFFKDWQENYMSPEEKKLIKDWKKCDFSKMVAHFEQKSAERKAMTKEEKAEKKAEREKLIEEFGWAVVDGHRERVGNFMVEPPGLFRGRGEHPKMGLIKKRIMPEDITINIGKVAKVPEPPPGHKWKKVVHDDTVTWLASWTENIVGNIKYVMLNAQSRLKGENDMKKYEKARELKKHIEVIRRDYMEDLKNKEMMVRQRATALYFIDKLALRVGNEKDTDEEADTVGCCSLRVEHVELIEPDQVAFDFLGKDSIRYQNQVTVIPQVYKNVKLFRKNKDKENMLFDRLSVPALNKHLQKMMPGLTAKVFRTYNASSTLQSELAKVDWEGLTVPELLLAYNRANREVAVLCNHQRSVPKTHSESMEKLKKVIDEMKEQYKELKDELKKAKKDGTEAKVEKKMKNLKERIRKKEILMTDRDENKTIALGTSKINYMDPRITYAWCNKVGLPIEKIFNKTLRAKFQWAAAEIEEDPDFEW
eukprot:comp21479_c0_seq1/m.29737 comp21479_c0_seq1/g.29737  ORF comp21479_c0_seq1/g.29737 comp21479_c0_seq1/m.29737 type:complete len:788 (-) comp21479_c0_seq1:314-2677(-)